MTKLRVLSAALITVAMFATPAMARESRVTSLNLPENADAGTTRGARYIGGSDRFRANQFGRGFGSALSDGYGGRDVWGHFGAYYGPMVPAPF
jgi:hypothetical protein